MRIWTRWHGWRATSALSFNISFIAFSLMISVDAITNKLSACGLRVHRARPAGSASGPNKNATHHGGR